jgi:hypothetical protein
MERRGGGGGGGGGGGAGGGPPPPPPPPHRGFPRDRGQAFQQSEASWVVLLLGTPAIGLSVNSWVPVL